MEKVFEFGKWWSPIPEYDGYFASEDGEILSFVKSRNKPRKLKPITSKDGHKYVFAYQSGEMSKLWIHRAVLLAWVGPPENGQEARHLNDNPADNSILNLAWGSRLENVDDKRRNGRLPVGERAGTHKLTEKQVLEIRRLHGTMSLRQTARRYGVSHTCIRRAALGIKWAYLEGKT